MPDIDPAALSRPSISSSTPILPPKSLSIVPPPSSTKTMSKTEKIPPRIDLEPLYTGLKNAIGEKWGVYSEAVQGFVMGKINQSELSATINPILDTGTGEANRLHNQLISAMYANSTREVPDHVVASWVSANDKPMQAGTKIVSGDEAEQRRKAEVMALPNRDRRRLKDVGFNDPEPVDLYQTLLADIRRIPKPSTDPIIPPPSTGGLGGSIAASNLAIPNLAQEIKKRYAHPLSSESGEFPDSSSIESRMLPMSFEYGLQGGAAPDAAQFMAVATETFIKGFLSSVFDKTRCNGPGSSGAAGAGGGAGWIMTDKYRRILEREEEDWVAGKLSRDKSGLLPIEAKAAGERGALGMADLRMALEIGDCGVGMMRTVEQSIMSGFREGELEGWDDFSALEGYEGQLNEPDREDVVMRGMESPTLAKSKVNGVNGKHKAQDEDVEMEDWGWEGAKKEDREGLNDLLDSILA